ncbi:hypothetical protein ACRRTK_013567 [Alexandromys fortis]
MALEDEMPKSVIPAPVYTEGHFQDKLHTPKPLSATLLGEKARQDEWQTYVHDTGLQSLCSALHEFPRDIFSNEDRRQGAVVLHVLCPCRWLRVAGPSLLDYSQRKAEGSEFPVPFTREHILLKPFRLKPVMGSFYTARNSLYDSNNSSTQAAPRSHLQSLHARNDTRVNDRNSTRARNNVCRKRHTCRKLHVGQKRHACRKRHECRTWHVYRKRHACQEVTQVSGMRRVPGGHMDARNDTYVGNNMHARNDTKRHMCQKRNACLERHACQKRHVCRKRHVCLKRPVFWKRHAHQKRHICRKRHVFRKRHA